MSRNSNTFVTVRPEERWKCSAMYETATLWPSAPSMRMPLDWRNLALVIAAHVATVGVMVFTPPMAERLPPPPPLFASVLLADQPSPDPAERPLEKQAPTPPQLQPQAATPQPQVQQTPEPEPQLAVPESAPVPATTTVVAEPDDPPPEAPTSEMPAPAAAMPSAPAPASLDALPGSPDDVRKYIAALMRQLHRYKTYPRELKKARIEGTVVVEFTIDRDGRLLASNVKRGSGYPELDRAAMDMLTRANPLPAIPAFMNRDELALAIPVEYSLITDR